MKKLRSLSILKNWKRIKCGALKRAALKRASLKWAIVLGCLFIAQLSLPKLGFGRLYIDINAPSIQRINIAIPDFAAGGADG